MTKASLLPTETIQSKILWIRGQKIIIDRDLAQLYGVETRTLNQAVKRNLQRFPDDFMFQLTKSELTEVITNCDNLASLKFAPSLPYAFTEHGILMLSSVLNSERAVDVNIQIMRTFTLFTTIRISRQAGLIRANDLRSLRSVNHALIKNMMISFKSFLKPSKN